MSSIREHPKESTIWIPTCLYNIISCWGDKNQKVVTILPLSRLKVDTVHLYSGWPKNTMTLWHDTVSTIVQYPLQRAHMIQSIIDIQIPPCLNGMFLGTFHTEPQGFGCREWLGFILFHWLTFRPSVPEFMLGNRPFQTKTEKQQFYPKHLSISLIFSFDTTRFILGQFRHLESHGPIDWTLPGSYWAAVPTEILPLPRPLRENFRVMVDSVNDVTARWALQL